MECEREPAGSKWDWILLAFAVVASVPFVFANAVVFRFRKRKYFQVQGGALLILASSACGLLWIASQFVVNVHFPRRGKFLRTCALWSFWLQLAFGFWLWFVCLIVRLYRLYLLCTSRNLLKHRRTWSLHIPILWSPALVFSLIATAVHASKFDGSGSCVDCKLDPAWKWSSFLVVPLCYFLILAALLFRSKGQKDYMLATEYEHTTENLLMAFVIFLLYSVAHITKAEMEVSGRCFLTFCVCSVVFLHFWVRMGRPVYLCLVKNPSEMDNFEEQLRRCGAECFDKISTGVDFRDTRRRMSTISSFQHHDGDWILRAIDAAVIEASECKERIDQLEQKKFKLSTKIKELEQSLIPITTSSTETSHGERKLM